jgi:hypothetical protein
MEKLTSLPLLKYYSSVLPLEVQREISQRFINIQGNLEFGTWIITANMNKINREAEVRGITMWQNMNLRLSFIYGVLETKTKKDIESCIQWLQKSSFPYRKTQVIFNNPQRPYLELYTFKGG